MEGVDNYRSIGNTNLLGSKFYIESQLSNPNRKLSVYVNNGLFNFITTL